VFEGLPEAGSGKPSGCAKEVDSGHGGARYLSKAKHLAEICTDVDKTSSKSQTTNRACFEGPMGAVPLHSWPCG